MNGDALNERDVQKLLGQLKAGNWLKVCHYGLSPAFVFSPGNRAIAHIVRHETAQQAINQLGLQLVETTWNFDVYRLSDQLQAAA